MTPISCRRASTSKLVGNAVWAEDSTHLGRDEDGKAVVGETIREVASTLVLHASAGAHLKGRDVVAALEEVRQACGGLPLVLATDNGSIYTMPRGGGAHHLSVPFTEMSSSLRCVSIGR